MVSIARDAGVDERSVRVVLAEWRFGLLSERSALDMLAGPEWVREARVLASPVDVALRRATIHFPAMTFAGIRSHRYRTFGDRLRELWQPRAPDARDLRADLAGRVDDVRVDAAAIDSSSSLVCVSADVRTQRKNRLVIATVVALAFGVGGAFLAFAAPRAGVTVIGLGLAVGLLVAASQQLHARRTRADLRRLFDAMDRWP